MRVVDYLVRFTAALKDQLEDDEKRHGDLWLEVPRKGMEPRIFRRLMAYYGDFLAYEKPIPWTKIAGLAIIGWIRETFPEDWPAWSVEPDE